MIEFDEEQLRNDVTDFSDIYKKDVKGFFARDDIKLLLENKSFDLLYNAWVDLHWNSYDLTPVFLLAHIDFLHYIDTIRTDMFRYCYLSAISIPKTIENIRSYAFSSNPALTEIKYEGSKNDWANIISPDWKALSNIHKVICEDGEIILE